MDNSNAKNINAASLDIFEDQIRECYGRVVYSHKTHEKCSDILFSRHNKLKWLQIILSAVTTVGFIAVIFGDNMIASIIGVSVSTLLLIVNTYLKEQDLGQIAQKHKNTAIELFLTREKYLTLLTDIRMGESSIDELMTIRDEILIELHNIYRSAPSTFSRGYLKAQDSLKNLEDMTFSDEEIDAFLPPKLKKETKK